MGSIRAVLAAMLVVMLAGCATSRSVVTSKQDAGSNPQSGIAVRVEAVEDRRAFQASPRSPDIPSLMSGEIGNKVVTARAVARKRNSYGMALGDVLLPEGDTVSEQVRVALTRGFREAGYRVLAKGEPGYEGAIPVSAIVDQFWSWFTPGFLAVKLESRAAVALKGDVAALKGNDRLQAQATRSMQLVTDDDWLAIVGALLDDLVVDLKRKLGK